jgi:hypothetical protein
MQGLSYENPPERWRTSNMIAVRRTGLHIGARLVCLPEWPRGSPQRTVVNPKMI